MISNEIPASLLSRLLTITLFPLCVFIYNNTHTRICLCYCRTGRKSFAHASDTLIQLNSNHFTLSLSAFLFSCYCCANVCLAIALLGMEVLVKNSLLCSDPTFRLNLFIFSLPTTSFALLQSINMK